MKQTIVLYTRSKQDRTTGIEVFRCHRQRRALDATDRYVYGVNDTAWQRALYVQCVNDTAWQRVLYVQCVNDTAWQRVLYVTVDVIDRGSLYCTGDATRREELQIPLAEKAYMSLSEQTSRCHYQKKALDATVREELWMPLPEKSSICHQQRRALYVTSRALDVTSRAKLQMPLSEKSSR